MNSFLILIRTFRFSRPSTNTLVSLPVFFGRWQLIGNSMISWSVTRNCLLSLFSFQLISFRHSTCCSKPLRHISSWIKSEDNLVTTYLSSLFPFSIYFNLLWRNCAVFSIRSQFQVTWWPAAKKFLLLPRSGMGVRPGPLCYELRLVRIFSCIAPVRVASRLR